MFTQKNNEGFFHLQGRLSLSSNAVDHDSSLLSLVNPHLLCIREWGWECQKWDSYPPGAVGLGAASQDKGSCCIKGSFFLYEKVTVLPVSIARWSRKWKGYSEFENRGTLWIPIHFSGRIIKKEDPQCQQQQEMESYCQNNYNWRTGPTGTAG